jgi:prepilin signal peptidase PulO-like enzyme (type II secretory pathway)
MLLWRTEIDYGLVKKRRPKKLTGLLLRRLADRNDRSVCDFCGKQLKWQDNIPVISWFILKGKSSCCGKKLPITYPLVELLTGILFLINFQFSNSNFQSILFYPIIVFLIFSAFFDLKWMILPDFSTLFLLIIGLFLSINIWAAVLSFVFLLFLYLVTKGKGMGFGDVKYALFMGLILGMNKMVIAYYIAFIAGALVGVVAMILKKKKFKSEIPFGPFLILGTIVAWWWGEKIWYYVLSWQK